MKYPMVAWIAADGTLVKQLTGKADVDLFDRRRPRPRLSGRLHAQRAQGRREPRERQAGRETENQRTLWP